MSLAFSFISYSIDESGHANRCLLLCHYVFVVSFKNSLNATTISPKAFLLAILTVNTYPFDWRHLREYIGLHPQLNIVSSRSRRAFALLSTSFRRRRLSRHRFAPAVTASHQPSPSGVLQGVIPTGRHPYCHPALLKDKLSSSSYYCFVYIIPASFLLGFSQTRSPLPPPN